ncbi:hypothetical protein ARMSODRAFT_979741 [Armillaria solidipes]|uniref:Uncharacterized protein n=1 Tax=Armillaria solidipes TaxID=1076256 RepID=A0A2H3B997_9AGAR|nr:hypothetical protein ARMSODRAFT_979741 [Armillaria solidipes]
MHNANLLALTDNSMKRYIGMICTKAMQSKMNGEVIDKVLHQVEEMESSVAEAHNATYAEGVTSRLSTFAIFSNSQSQLQVTEMSVYPEQFNDNQQIFITAWVQGWEEVNQGLGLVSPQVLLEQLLLVYLEWHPFEFDKVDLDRHTPRKHLARTAHRELQLKQDLCLALEWGRWLDPAPPPTPPPLTKPNKRRHPHSRPVKLYTRTVFLAACHAPAKINCRGDLSASLEADTLFDSLPDLSFSTMEASSSSPTSPTGPHHIESPAKKELNDLNIWGHALW